jgi:hypothetical protein
MEESLLKSNFVGRDGFRWWVGQIAPIKEWIENTTNSKNGWGFRYKVRIMGYHPANNIELKDEDLPWAQTLLPTTAGTGAGGYATDVKLQEGDIVFGFFLDGDDAQLPVIMGAFGRSDYIVSQSEGPFKTFVPTNKYIKAPDGATSSIAHSQSTSGGPNSVQNPTNKNQSRVDGINEVALSDTTGNKILLASKKPSTLDKISNAIDEFLAGYQKYADKISKGIEWARDWLKQEIDFRVEQLEKIVTPMVEGAIKSVMDKLIPLIKAGLKILYGTVYGLVFAATLSPVEANKAGELAERAMIPVVNDLEKRVKCLGKTIVKTLGNIIRQMLYAIVDTIANFASCVAEQFMGSLMNSIIGQIASALQSAIGGLQSILKYVGGFNTEEFLRSAGESFLDLLGLPKCENDKVEDVREWVIGKGPKLSKDTAIQSVLDVANAAFAKTAEMQGTDNPIEGIAGIVGAFDIFNEGIQLPDFSGIGDCFAGLPQFCGPPTINIFGGGGSGASAVPLFGNLIDGAGGLTGSIIGVKMTNPGSGYSFPPFVEIADNCNQGYGAVARAVIKDGQVTNIYIVTEGENYPAERNDYVVNDVVVLDPGEGYTDGDVVTDTEGNTYQTQIAFGYITKVTPINTNSISTGAILKPLIDPRKEFQGEVKKVVDCITQ